MSSSHDSSCSLHLVDSHGKKKGCMFRVRKGVTTFDYSKEWNIIGASGGGVCILEFLSASSFLGGTGLNGFHFNTVSLISLAATGGLDRAVRFWNPYVTGKPIAVSIHVCILLDPCLESDGVASCIAGVEGSFQCHPARGCQLPGGKGSQLFQGHGEVLV